MKEISTQELSHLIADVNVQIIDVRPVEYYNGWKKFNEKRGGHIKGARSLPVKWINYLDWTEIVESKGIKPEQALVIYSYSMDDSENVAERFQKSGFSNIKLYTKFLDEWVADDSLPMAKLERYKHLVSAEWLYELIETGKAPEYDNNNYVICHGHYRNPADYEQCHIQQAISVDSNTLENPETWNIRTPEELKETLEGYGITAETTVILYGRFSFPDNDDPFPGSAAGHLGSIRCAFIMLYAGVKDVRILNGGLQSWQDAGYEVTKETFDPKPVSDFGAQIPVHPELAVDIPEAKDIIASDNANLVSVRSWAEYIGEVSGYNYIEKKGRIKGSVYSNLEISDAYHMESFRNLDHTMREFQEVEEKFKEVGITPDKHNAFYCGTGWRGSEAFFNVWLMGWPRVSVFDGGWFEWSNNNLPSETGDPNKD